MKHLAFVVAKIGKNAEMATDPNDFIFHSDYNTYKIIKEGTKTVTLAASTNDQTFTEAHLQKFIPLVHAFAKESTLDQLFLPNSANVDTWGTKVGIIDTGVTFNYAETDDTNMIFNFSNTNASTKEVSIRYLILEAIQ